MPCGLLDLTTVPTSAPSRYGDISPINKDRSLKTWIFALLSITSDKLEGVALSKD